MTTSPYSLDLRKKVINHIKQGYSQLETSTLFHLHKNTVNRWWTRYNKEGILSARTRPGFKSKVDHAAMAEYVISNSNVKLYELGKIYKITASQASRILRKLGFSYKKKPLPMWKQATPEEMNTSKRS
jgi:transposase